MKKKIAMLAIAGTSIGMFATSSTASAAHCLETVLVEGVPVIVETPGFSYFGNDHVKESTHNEGNGVHMGTSGASNCRETTGSPSERAPGRN